MNLLSTRNQWMMSFGMLLGVLYGIILKLAIEAFGTASFILYGDIYTIPLLTAIIVSLLAYVMLATSYVWAPVIENLMVELVEWARRNNP
jgi:hypothetical protein